MLDNETTPINTQNVNDRLSYCYAASSTELANITCEQWLAIMIKNFTITHREAPNEKQVIAWKDCFECTSDFFKACSKYNCSFIFEYILPYEGGRRPDVIVLSGDNLIVLEYKMTDTFKLAHIDQVSQYARDLKGYHGKTRNLNVIPVLVPTKLRGKYKYAEGILICTPDLLFERLSQYLNKTESPNLMDWINSQYIPLPSLIEAAKRVYFNEELPQIRKANSAGIPEAVSCIIDGIKQTKQNHSRTLVLVTGVPGAGKTLLGLDVVYKSAAQELASASFLSGNGPLVMVLQDALKSKTFVKPLRNYIDEYGKISRNIPEEHIVVFDEAQRAWDREKVASKRGINLSEPDLIIQIADKLPEWCVMVGLIGEGQEIYSGEESGIQQWNDALEKSSNSWNVLCPPKISKVFTNASETIIRDELNLTISLRSHLSDDISKWVAHTLDNKIAEAQELSKLIFEQCFKIYITRSLQKAKLYCVRRYESQDKTYGLICSSRAQILTRYGVNNDRQSTHNMSVAKWFNDPIGSDKSCRSFNNVITEFACQGLELDMPIVCWGEDFRWNNGKLCLYSNQKGLKDPYQIRLNCYRVLLTRGRDGFIIYVPEDPILDETYNTLIDCGAVKLI